MALSSGTTTATAISTTTTAVKAAGGGAHHDDHGLARSLELLRRLKSAGLGMATETTHASLPKRDLSGGAIAGTAVGVVVVAGLLAFCLYPFILYRLRRRQNADHAPFDAEAAMAAEPDDFPAVTKSSHRRPSSGNSFKQNGDLARGRLTARGSRELGWGVSHGGNGFADATLFASGDAGLSDPVILGEYQVQAAPFPQLGCRGELAPRLSDDHPSGLLKGASADYYSPDIPSEAFGMIAQPEPALESPMRSFSHRSSLRYNMMQMFRRKSERDRTMGPTISSTAVGEPSSPSPTVPHLRGVTPERPSIITGDQVESPPNISPASSSPPSSASQAHNAPLCYPGSCPPEATANMASPARQQLDEPPPAPGHAVPGTVNPMDIMPASTESEVWHRTEHQLFTASPSYKIPPSNPVTMSQLAHAAPPIMPSPPSPHLERQNQPMLLAAQSPHAADDIDLGLVLESAAYEDPAMPDSTSQKDSNPTSAPKDRHPSLPSNPSTPFPGHAFADPSSQNTPLTQLDSPSPESGESSDFRPSISPPVRSDSHSPKGYLYRCDEPGCNQVYDQVHKLNHHQRYHNKDKKCPYPGCGKGFGTKTHLQRHINDRHEKRKKYHCSIASCDYSRIGGKGFPRKDNWKRHMINIHHMNQQQLPEPVEVEMGGRWN